MRGQTQSEALGDTGTQVANNHNYEHASTNNEQNQQIQPSRETEQVQQQNINVTNINPTDTEPNTNSFYNSWGDTLPHPKPAGSVRLAMQNFGGWPQWNKNPKNEMIRQYLNEKNIDIFITMENNVAWHKIPPAQCLLEQMHGWGKASHLSIAHNQKDRHTNPYQLGGVVILSHNRVAHHVAGMGQDPMGLGRFCSMTYQGKMTLQYKYSQDIGCASQKTGTCQCYNNTGDTKMKIHWTTWSTPKAHFGQICDHYYKNELCKATRSSWDLMQMKTSTLQKSEHFSTNSVWTKQ